MMCLVTRSEPGRPANKKTLQGVEGLRVRCGSRRTRYEMMITCRRVELRVRHSVMRVMVPQPGGPRKS
nr:hypothetical protein GCM10025730_43410 [Promicromonospora thailandica]